MTENIFVRAIINMPRWQPPPTPWTLTGYPTPGVGGTPDFYTSKWAQKMNYQLHGILRPHWFAFWRNGEKSTGGWRLPPPLGRQGLITFYLLLLIINKMYKSLYHWQAVIKTLMGGTLYLKTDLLMIVKINYSYQNTKKLVIIVN